MEKLGKTADMLLEAGAMLMGAGANTERIRITINRIAHALGYEVELLITHRALMLSVIDRQGEVYTSKVKRTPPHGVNFKVLSGISRLSWKMQDEQWALSLVNEELLRLKNLPHYKRWQILVLVGLAGASFCRLFGGEWPDLIIAFVATIIGLFIRQETLKRQFNGYICVYLASTGASLLSGLAVKTGLGPNPELAFATSILFLIPGVPLINSFTDLIDGNLATGLMRVTNGMIIAFMIALGLLTVKLIYQI